VETHDVLIIGGGPAGSSCAAGLRRRGLRPLVLDKQTFPRDKTCAGWVTPPVFAALGIDPAEYNVAEAASFRRTLGSWQLPLRNVLQPITGFRTGMLGGKEVATRYDHVVSYGIRRCEFDHFLLKRCGAELRLGEPLTSLKREGNEWIVNGSLRTPLLVGAGGHFCPVARELGNRKQPLASVVAAQEIEFEVSPDELDCGTIAADTPELFFCPDLKGYGWCFRKGNFLNIGLGRTDRERLSEHVAKFCDFLKLRGKVTADIPAKLHGHAYQLYENVSPKLLDDGVLLVGDSAGLSYPQSGEGIRPAVESGLMAADVIATAGGDYRRDRLAEYERRITARFGTPRPTALSDRLPNGLLRFLAARLLSSRWFSRRVVLNHWFLHAGEKPLSASSV
jgi:flavin-dependent dehydrogenase